MTRSKEARRVLAGWAVPVAVALGALGGFLACGAETSDQAGSGRGGSPGGTTASSAGSGQAGSSGGLSGATGGASATCPSAECGPALGLPNSICSDGSMGGPTGRCLRLEAGGCGWEVRRCPPEGEGGAASTGGSASAGGAGGSTATGGGEGGTAVGAAGSSAVDRCGGCNYTGTAPQICIYQAGGPGPARFVCATQNPCGAAGACACIVGQGTCGTTLEGGSPGYCVCDNGLD